jgi:L-Ala-D/L-Glu epimerase
MLSTVLSRALPVTHRQVLLRRFALHAPFSITRFTVDAIEPVWVGLRFGPHQGQGEGNRVDYEGETGSSLTAQIEEACSRLGGQWSLAALQDILPAGAARNALGSALLDLLCKAHGRRAWQLLNLAEPGPLITCNTIGLAAPQRMADSAVALAAYPVLKIKLGHHADDAARIEAVRRARPDATLLVDANAGWTLAEFRDLLPTLRRCAVELIEQPLAPGADAELAAAEAGLPIAADESVSDTASLAKLPPGYSHVNIKLDKTGGLPEALLLAAEAQRRGWRLMVGNMMGSSLGMAPAFLLAPSAQWIDLDGPIDLVADCEHAITYQHACMQPPPAALWG